MRHFDVYKYDVCPAELNPEGQPPYWVWKVVKVNPTDPVADGASRMSLIELRDYKSSQKSLYNAWIETKVSADAVVRKKIKKAIVGAETLIIKYATENVMGGITQYGKTKLIADALKEVMYYAQTGSLYEAISALDAIVITESMAPFFTENKRQELKTAVLNLISSL